MIVREIVRPARTRMSRMLPSPPSGGDFARRFFRDAEVAACRADCLAARLVQDFDHRAGEATGRVLDRRSAGPTCRFFAAFATSRTRAEAQGLRRAGQPKGRPPQGCIGRRAETALEFFSPEISCVGDCEGARQAHGPACISGSIVARRGSRPCWSTNGRAGRRRRARLSSGSLASRLVRAGPGGLAAAMAAAIADFGRRSKALAVLKAIGFSGQMHGDGPDRRIGPPVATGDPAQRRPRPRGGRRARPTTFLISLASSASSRCRASPDRTPVAQAQRARALRPHQLRVGAERLSPPRPDRRARHGHERRGWPMAARRSRSPMVGDAFAACGAEGAWAPRLQKGRPRSEPCVRP